jgi:hypothetical protein
MGKKKGRKSLDKLRKSLQNKQFVKAMFSLHKMSKQKQREAAMQASPQFIRDLCKVLSNLRNHPELLNAKQRKRIQPHVNKLRKLIHSKTSIAKKRLILSQTANRTHAKAPFSSKRTLLARPIQKGGILPILIPIICASIAGGTTIAASAVGAAIMKS